MTAHNTSWLELNTHQPKDAMAFYAKTLGWEFEPSDLPQGGAYWVAWHNDKAIGGVFSLDDANHADIPSHWMTYMQVGDIQLAQITARQSGGEVTRPALYLDGIGKLAVITDSSGALVGLIEREETDSKNLLQQ